MSAILGLIHFDGQPIAIESLWPALDVLAHRGPDGQGRWQEGPVLLAHWMLHTTPESLHEQQPLIAPEGDLVLVADARIDNRDELLTALRLRSSAERPITDAELILAAYRRWGTACPDRLIGDFAFALWDRRTRQLFAARDGMGVRPFYYLHDGRRFAFATLLPAIRRLPEVLQDIDEELVHHFMTDTLDQEKERTFYRAIRRLPGGHALLADAQGLRLWRYWQPDLEQEVRFRTEAEYMEAFRACFEESVRCRLRSAFSIGSHLSGGLDSSSVTSMAATLLRRKNEMLYSFSAIFRDIPDTYIKWIDERDYVDEVIRKYENIYPIFLDATKYSPIISLEEIIARYSQPFEVSNYHLIFKFSKIAREKNIRVMLNGIDGDTVISYGWDWLTYLFEQKRWIRFEKEIKMCELRYKTSFNQLAIQLINSVLIKWLCQLKWIDVIRAFRWISVYYKSISKKILIRNFLLKLLNCRKHSINSDLSLIQRHWRQIIDGGWQWAVEFVDIVERSNNIESRYPFFDRRLIELSISYPLFYKLRNGWTRYILRLSLGEILPEKNRWRVHKSSIDYAFHKALYKYEKKRLKMIMNDNKLGEYVSSDYIYKNYNYFCNNLMNDVWVRSRSAFILYKLIILKTWLETIQ